MDSTRSKWEELNISRDEVRSIAEAMKKEEFRKLLMDYAEDVSSPASIKEYQNDIIQLEAERGIDCVFLNPEPGFVLKTSLNGERKAFINICSNHLIGKPVSTPTVCDNNKGLQWNIPYSHSPGREDCDKKHQICMVYDILFHPDTLQFASKNKQFRQMVVDTALNGVEQVYSVSLDRSNVRFPKLKYKGIPKASVVRKRIKDPVLTDKFDFPYPLQEPSNDPPMVVKQTSNKLPVYATPKYLIKYRSDVDFEEFTGNRFSKAYSAIPKELVVEINLPLLKSSETLKVDIFGKSFKLICDTPVKYKLDLQLPYNVTQDGNAKFDSDRKMLFVTLPVERKKFSDYIREDSGIESDMTNEEVAEDFILTDIDNNNYQPDVVYTLPYFNYSHKEGKFTFTLNVKNVDPISMKKVTQPFGFHITFSSIGSGYFPINYSFYVKFPTDVDSPFIDVWDNNLTIQFLTESPVCSVGLDENSLKELAIDEIPDIAALKLVDETMKEDVQEEEEEVICDATTPLPKLRSFSESSSDEPMIHRVRKSILKNRINRSLSESCVDYGIVSSSIEELPFTCSDSCIPETDENQPQLKKTVTFSQNIQKQVFRANSSILGQRKKNQKRSRNKKRAMERRVSESENSEEDGKEKWMRRINVSTSQQSIEPLTGILSKKKKNRKSKSN